MTNELLKNEMRELRGIEKRQKHLEAKIKALEMVNEALDKDVVKGVNRRLMKLIKERHFAGLDTNDLSIASDILQLYIQEKLVEPMTRGEIEKIITDKDSRFHENILDRVSVSYIKMIANALIGNVAKEEKLL